MKRFKQLFMLIALMCTATSAWADSNFSGSGTENSPFLIQSNEDLLKFRDLMESTETYSPYNKSYFKLTTDLTFTGTNNFTPIGGGQNGGCSFQGVLDGDGHMIRGLNATSNINNYTGAALFYQLWGATIMKLTLQECSFSVNSYSGSPTVGAFAVSIRTWDSKSPKIIDYHVIDCTLRASSTTYDQTYTGGIVGEIYDTGCYVQDCMVEGTTTCSAKKYCGAIVGKPITLDYTHVTNNCYEHTVQVTDLNTSTTYTTNDIGVAGATRPYDLPGQAEPAGPVVTFVYSGKTVLTIRALEVGGTVTVPSVEEMESTYSIQNATFT